jgi:predicted nucleic acid-binding protein
VAEALSTLPPVVNASPLIFLSRGGYLDLLQLAGEQVLVPEPVAEEVRRRGSDDVTVRALNETPWLVVTTAPSIPPIIQAWDLGLGESAVLALAYAQAGTEVIIDDLAGRRCAVSLGIPVRGTLGLVLTAKRHGRIEAARPVVEQLIQSGMYLSQQIVDEALMLVGE